MGFKWLLPGLSSSSASVQYPQEYCCGQTDSRTVRQPCSQHRQVFSPSLCAVQKPPGCWDSPQWSCKSIPPEHPSRASLQSIPPRCHGDAVQEEAGCCTPLGGLLDPPSPTTALSLGWPVR